VIAPRSEAAAAELLGVVGRGGQVVEEGFEKERVKAKAMKRKFRCVGLGYEDQPGAMQLDAWGLGESMWKQHVEQWLKQRSEDANLFYPK